MQSADPSQVSSRPRFPALDPEPPPRPWRQVAVGLVVILAGLGSWLGFALSGPSANRTAAAAVPHIRGLAGVVLSETPASYLSATDMQTGRLALFRSLGQFSSNPNPAVSSDGKYLLDAAVGRLLSLSRPGHPESVPNALSFVAGNMPGFLANPWSDHDSGVVELGFPVVSSQGLQATIPVAAVESVATGHAVSLGPADSASGDPLKEGAFIAVPAPGRPLSNGIQPDGRLILADAGAPSHLLATTAQLNHVLGNKPGATVSLVPVASPLGSMVAVEVVALTDGSSGIVVLSREGKVLGSEPLGIGFTSTIGWSHSGTVLAFANAGPAGAELTEWKIADQSVTTALHDASATKGPSACVWSPDDASVLCDGGPRGNWLVIRSGTESVTAGQGQPLAWTNGRLGG